MSKSKEEEFRPPTGEELSKRKVYGGGSTDVPPGRVKGKGRGWWRDYEKHAEKMREVWASGKRKRVTPEVKKRKIHGEKKGKRDIMQGLHRDYPDASNAKSKDAVEFSNDTNVIYEGSKIESEYIKDDEELRQEGQKESMQVEREKKELTGKIRKYEDEEDDDLKKEIADEDKVIDERKQLKEKFDTNIQNSKNVIGDYERLEGDAGAREKLKREAEDKKERIQREAKEKAERMTAAQQRGKKEKQMRDHLSSLRSSLGVKNRELSSLESDKSKAESEYRESISYQKKRHPDYSDKQINDIVEVETDKNNIERINVKISELEGKIETSQRDIIIADGELSDLIGVRETTGQKGTSQDKKSDIWERIKREGQKQPIQREEKKKVSIGDAPKDFHARKPGQTDQEAWNKIHPDSRYNFLKARKLDEEYYKKYPQERAKHEDRTGDTSTKRDPDVPLDFKGTDREWNAMSRTERVNWRTKHPKSGSTTKSTQAEPKGYKDYSELPYELKSSRNVNAALIDQYKQRHPRVKERLIMSDKGLEFADEEVLDRYLKIVVKGNSQDIRDKKEFLANNILHNRTEYNRVNNTNY